MSKLLINEPPIQVLPTLATAIGLNRAIVLQQVHYWCANTKMGVVRDGKRWIRNTAEDWQRDNFPFWSLSTVRRVIESLESGDDNSKGGGWFLLSRSDLNKSGYDRTKWYTIDYEKLNNTIAPPAEDAKPVDSIYSNWVDGNNQDEQIKPPNVSNSLSETTTETTTETTLPASQAQPRKFVSAIDPDLHDELLVALNPLSLQDELMALNGTAPTVSPRTEKKERKPREPKVTSIPPDANNYHREMFAALATLCVLDPKVKQVRGQLNSVAKQLLDAGYTVADLEKYGAWWKSQDWRGQRGDAPTLGVIPKQILQATQWVPWTPPAVPAKKNGPGLEALRSWHYQYCYEQWNDHVAAELGVVNLAMPGVFREWYDSEASIPDDQLADWYDWWTKKNEESHQW